MKNLPKARAQNIIVQHLKDEVLIYDLSTNKAFNLNETVAKVFNSCDGKTSFEQLKRQYGFSDDLILLALDELKNSNLLECSENFTSPLAGMNRREVIRKIGLTSLVALPVISALVVPTAAHAASAACVATGDSFTTPTDPATGASACLTPQNDARCCSGNVASSSYDGTSNFATCTCGLAPL